MRSPRRLSRPTTSERRRPRSEPSDRPESFRGIWTRRPSARIAIATWRRFRPSNRPKDGLQNKPGRPGWSAQSTSRLMIMQPPGPHPAPNGAADTIWSGRVRRARRRDGPADEDTCARTSRDRRLPDGLLATKLSLEMRGGHFQRCPASRTRAELASADKIRTTRKARAFSMRVTLRSRN